jgi:MSHA pilin protein MshC
VAVIAVASILAVVALPRLWGASFDEERFHDETLAALRYAQRSAIAYQRNVCVTFSGGNQLALTYASNYGAGEACGPALPPPGGTSGSYVVQAPGATSYLSASSISFNLLGVPSAGQTITLSGGSSIVVEADPGYVH